MHILSMVLLIAYVLGLRGTEAHARDKVHGFECTFKHGGFSYQLNLKRDEGISLANLDPLDRTHLLMNVDVPRTPRGGEWQTLFDAHLLVHRQRSAEPELVLGFESSLFARGALYKLVDQRFEFAMEVDTRRPVNSAVSFVDFRRQRIKAKMRCTQSGDDDRRER